MQLIQILILFINIINIGSFKTFFNINLKRNHLIQNKNIQNKNLILFYNNNNNTNTIIEKYKKPNKINSFLKLIRSNNIVPTFLLCFSGGWIMNPSIEKLINSPQFIVSTIDTILIMSASMVLNDIYDIEIDKINSHNRPLVNGEIKIKEALFFALLLIGISEYLALAFLPDNLKFIIQLAIIQISIYTPILKRIIIIKNISCASLVSFSLFFTGLSSSDRNLITLNKNFGLLSIAMSLIFLGSWCNELLLDMRDIKGDRSNKIITIPTLFGNKFSWIFSNFLLSVNILSNTLSISYLYNNPIIGSFIPIILSPLLLNLYKIRRDNYSEESIINYMKYSNFPLLVLLFYLCLLSNYRIII